MRRALALVVWAVVSAAWAAQTPAPPRPQAVPLPHMEVDASRSEVRFLLDTTWHVVEGHAKDVTGTVTSDSGDPFVDGRISIEVKTATMQTGNGRRDKDMREVMAVQQHPTIKFVSTAAPETVSITRLPNGSVKEAVLNIPGDLTIRGVTHQITLPATVYRQQEGYRVNGDVVVSLAEYKIPDPSIFVNKVKDKVGLTVDVYVHASAR
ncbi:MAG: YceI family protein [Candidatus Polarisedimenticolia bacterium]